MTPTTPEAKGSDDPSVAVNTVTLDHPWRWIEAGWSDFRRAPAISLIYGMIFVLISYLLVVWLFLSDRFFLVPPLTAGYFLVTPFLALGLYDVSRRLERDEVPDIGESFTSWRVNPFNLFSMGLVLVLLLLFWMMAANFVFAIFYTGITPRLDQLFDVLFLSGNSPLFLAMGVVSGSFFALAAFSISVVAVPMLVDRKIDLVTAISTSLSAVRSNYRPLMLWAALIVMFVGLGLITFFIGLAVLMPVVGYASWHAYRDLVAAH
ncbi:MAG: DUF2189 domain-containing protein [Gammaproteobacteria bacterium]|nr:DUF2189 domain-containing protein [Gammaproteobacteria bacterium]MCB1849397.1 DUF2189 domain-containing protein [Gammaproteobacteria bacterium]MCP5416223.1 DUF2189 domain-containing protein [Chromatiaceae bacterium]